MQTVDLCNFVVVGPIRDLFSFAICACTSSGKNDGLAQPAAKSHNHNGNDNGNTLYGIMSRHS